MRKCKHWEKSKHRDKRDQRAEAKAAEREGKRERFPDASLQESVNECYVNSHAHTNNRISVKISVYYRDIR